MFAKGFDYRCWLLLTHREEKKKKDFILRISPAAAQGERSKCSFVALVGAAASQMPER